MLRVREIQIHVNPIRIAGVLRKSVSTSFAPLAVAGLVNSYAPTGLHKAFDLQTASHYEIGLNTSPRLTRKESLGFLFAHCIVPRKNAPTVGYLAMGIVLM